MTTTHIFKDLIFLQELKEQGITLCAGERGLVCKAEPGTLTPQIRERITKAKPRLLKLLEGMKSEEELPRLKADPTRRNQPFPLTENQEAYWLGRGSEQDSGDVGIHIFFEVQCIDFDTERFCAAWSEVVKRHDMLRAVVLPDGTQMVQEAPPEFIIKEYDQQSEGVKNWELKLKDSRNELSHQCYNLENWPQFSFNIFRTGRDALIMGSLDCWAMDGRSLQIIFNDLEAIYSGKPLEPLPEVSFRDYVLHLETIRTSAQYQNSWKYWQERIKKLPQAPRLPLAESSSDQGPSFSRKKAKISADQWNSLCEEARKRELTMASLLLACYAETLSKWSEDKHFTINVPRWNRLPVHPRINDIAGEFASFSLMEVDRRQPLSFAEHAHILQQQVWDDLRNGHVSGVKVLREWRRELGLTPGTLVPYVFTSEPEAENGQSGSWVSSLERIGQVKRTLTQTPQVWIDSQYAVVDGNLFLFWDVDQSMFPSGMPDKMFAAYADLVRNLAEKPQTWESITPVPLPEEEQIRRKTLVGQRVAVNMDRPWDRLKKNAAEIPLKKAISDKDGSLNWQQFKDEVLLWQDRLSHMGVSAGTPVALALSKGRLQPIASMAIHGLGGVIIPLDHNLPQSRGLGILENSGARLMLTDGATEIRPEETGGYALDMTADWDKLDLPKKLLFNEALLDPSLYCVIYTSGSTGTPKGVMVPMRGILNMMQHTLGTFNLGKDDAVLSLSPLHHDLALFDVVGSISGGIHMVFPDPDLLRDPGHWVQCLTKHKVSVWNTVPAMMTMLLDFLDSNTEAPRLPALRISILGGDWIPTDTPPRLAEHARNCTLISSGGPTETTGWNILYPVEEYNPAWKSIPYGRPIQNVTYHVWDHHLQDCPELVPGELFCSGEGITAGYLHDEGKTRRSYLKHPQTGVPMFRTGDLGRLTPHGHIEFIGRRDHQVNLNGYRIELGEVEATLNRHSQINQAVATIHKNAGGNGFIGLWCTCLPGTQEPAEIELKAYLKELLPRHMHPRFIGVVQKFPLNKNNKIDRQTIAEWEAPQTESGIMPETDMQREVASAWKTILGQQSLHIDQNFFELGGDSIAAVRLYTSLLAEEYPGLHVSTIFSNPTIRELARVMEKNEQQTADSTQLPTIKKQCHNNKVPATRAQQRLWFESQNRNDHTHHILHFNIKITGDVSPWAIQEALNSVISRHEALRTSLIFHEDKLIQQVNPQVELPLVVEDLRADHPQKAMTIFEGLRQSNALKPISMENAPMGRASLILLNENEARLLLAFHHAVFDGWSMGIFMDDLSSDLRGSTLSNPEYSQADLGCWEQDPQTLQAIQAHIDAMKQEFLNEEAVTRLWSTKKDSAGNSLPNYDSVNIEISRELAEDLSKLASKAGVTGFAATCTLFGLTLARHTNSQQVRIGTYAATRAIPGLESMMGMLVNPVPLNLEYGTDSLLDTLKDNSRHIAKAQERAVVPFDILVRELAPARTAGEHPLFTIAFSQDNSPARIYEGGGMSLQLLAGKQHSTALDMEVSLLSQENGSLLVTATFNNSRFSSRAITDILKRFRFVAEQAAQHPKTDLNALEIRTPKDISLLSAWNNTQKNFPHTQSLLAPFMDMVSRTPLHCPVSGQAVLSSTEPTYKELLQSIEGLIRVLRNTDIQPGDFVGLHLSPGIDTAIAMLACWGCGAAFFPLAENLPAARLKQQAKTAQAKLILTEEKGVKLWKGVAIPALSLEIIRTHPCFPSHEVEHVEFSRNGKDTVACLYFTSGSSGTPKAVQLSHGNLLNRIQWLWHAIPRESQEKWCAKTSISFVDSLCEYLCPLLYGGDLYICSTNEATNPENLLNTVIEQEVTRLTVVPTLLEAMLDLLEKSPKDVSKLHHLTTSGEQLSRHLARRCNKLLPHVALYNFYGSTEITADATWHVVDPVSKGPVPIGKPIANISVAVLDENQREFPHGIPGEIWISGAGTGLGYVAPEDKGFFIHNGAPSFATGDLGMWTHEGELLYLGRKDRQLKIRGQRVEPAETEYALKQLRTVRDAAVFGMSMQNDIILAAAVVPFKGESVTPEGIRASLLSILPSAMIPSIFLTVEEIPLTTSGKVDVQTLKKMAETTDPSQAKDIDGETQTKLARLWKDLLGKAPISPAADFFASGGHSLLATRLATRIREDFNVTIKTNQIFEMPILADMASAIDLLASNTHEYRHDENECREMEEF